MARIAIIPARSGSKGYKDKNIALLNDKPLLAYTIEAALKSDLFDLVHVSTDSEQYAEIARAYGADVSFLREKDLAQDKSNSWSVLKFVITQFKNLGLEYEELVLLQPTSPLRDKNDILQAHKLMKEKNSRAVVSVCEVDHPPVWMNSLPKDLSMANFIKEEYANLARQDIEKYYRLNGAIYWMTTELLFSGEDIFKNSYALVMSPEHSVDIDNKIDFLLAEALLKNK